MGERSRGHEARGRAPGGARSTLLLPRAIRRREGREVPFDRARIAAAVRRTMEAVGEDDPPFADEVADVVTLALAVRPPAPTPGAPAGSPRCPAWRRSRTWWSGP